MRKLRLHHLCDDFEANEQGRPKLGRERDIGASRPPRQTTDVERRVLDQRKQALADEIRNALEQRHAAIADEPSNARIADVEASFRRLLEMLG